MQTLLLVLGGLVVGILVGWLRGAPANVRYARVQPLPVNHALPPAGESARRSAAFLRELVGLADRLTARDIHVRKLACEPCWFWELVLQKGADADQGDQDGLTRVFWDGREYDLSIASASFPPGAASDGETFASPQPGPDQLKETLPAIQPVQSQWKLELRKKIGRTGDAIGVAEDLVTRRFSGSAGTTAGPA